MSEETLILKVDSSQVARGEQALRNLDRAAGSAEKSVGGLTAATRGLGAALAGIGIAGFAKSLFDAGVQLERVQNGLRFATGSAEAARREYEWLRKTVNTLGADLGTAGKAYTSLAAAAQGTALQGKAARDIFTAIGKAATVMGLSAEQADGALTAIGQMISKGTVQAEELRGQLGERLPGAFQMAAKAMGVTTAELGKLLESGQVFADEFLPKLAAQLEKNMAEGFASASQSAQAALNRFNTAWLETKQAVANAGFLDAATAGLTRLTDILRGLPGFVGGMAEAFRAGFASVVISVDSGVTALAKAVAYMSALPGLILQNDEADQKLTATLASLNAQHTALVDKELARQQLYRDGLAVDRARAEATNDAVASTEKALTAQERWLKAERELQENLKASAAAGHQLSKSEKELIALQKAWAEGTRNITEAEYQERVAVLKTTVALEAKLRASKSHAKVHDELGESLARSNKGLFEEVERLRESNAEIGLSREAVDGLTVARAYQAAAAAQDMLDAAKLTGLTETQNQLLQEQVDLLKYRARLLQDRATRNAAADAAKATMEEATRSAETLQQSITDALMRAFEGGKDLASAFKDTLKNMFKTLVLRPLVNFALSPITHGFSAMAGAMGGQNTSVTGGPPSGGAGGLGIVGNIVSLGKSAFSAFSGGASSISSGYAAFAGSSIGQSLGLSTGLMGPQTAAGAWGGAALTSAGQTIGAALPWIGLAIGGATLVASLFKKKARQPSPSGTWAFQVDPLGQMLGGSAAGRSIDNMDLTAIEGMGRQVLAPLVAETVRSMGLTLPGGTGTQFFSGYDQPSNKAFFGIQPGGAGVREAFQFDPNDAASMAEAAAKMNLRLIQMADSVANADLAIARFNISADQSAEAINKDIATAVNFRDALEAFRQGTGDFASTIKATAAKSVQDATATVLEFRSTVTRLGLDIGAANAATMEFAEIVAGLRPAAPQLTVVKQNLVEINARFAAMPALLMAVGYSAEQATEAVGVGLRNALVDLATQVHDTGRAIGFELGYYTEAEMAAWKMTKVLADFAKVQEGMGTGAVLPRSAAQLRALIETQETLTQGGIALFDSLVGLAPAFMEAAKAADALALSVAQGALSKLQRAIKADLDARREALDTEKTRLSEALDELRTATNAQIDAARKQVDLWAGLLSPLEQAAASTRITSLELDRARRAAALTVLRQGPSAGVPALTAALEEVARPSEQLFGSFVDYARDQRKAAAAIAVIRAEAEKQTTEGQRLIDTLESQFQVAQASTQIQIDALQGAYDQQAKGYADTLAMAQDQLDALRGIDVGVVSVADAMASLAAAILAAGTPIATPGRDPTGLDVERWMLDPTTQTQTWKSTGGATGTLAPGETYGPATQIATNVGAFTVSDIQQYVASIAATGDFGRIRDEAISAGLSSNTLERIMGWEPGATTSIGGLPAFAEGANFLPFDTLAQVHQGERIIPAADNRELMARLDSAPADDPQATRDREDMRQTLRNLQSLELRMVRVLERWDGEGLPAERVV